MDTTSKLQDKGQITIPTHLRKRVGLEKGDLVEFLFQGGKLVITPKVIVDRTKTSTSDDEYTTAQRRIIDARLSKSEKEIAAEVKALAPSTLMPISFLLSAPDPKENQSLNAKLYENVFQSAFSESL